MNPRALRASVLAAFLPLCVSLGMGAALAQSPWIHVEVTEDDGEESHVKVNLPLSVVEVAIDAAPEKIISGGQIHLHHIDEDIDVEDLRRLWQELRETGDAELVSVEETDQTVRVRREGDRILIEVDDRAEGNQAHIEVPVEVVDALFSGERETLNLRGAIARLRDRRGDIVRVDDGKTKVRVWIDERN